MKRWAEVDAANKVTANRVSSDDDPPTSGLQELIGDPPFNGGTYNPATKKVIGAPTPPPSRGELLKAKDKATWLLADVAEGIQEML